MLDLRTTKNPRGLGERIGNALTYVVKMRYLYLMCIPGLIYLFIFHYMPMYGVIIAFKDFSYTKGIVGSKWLGFSYFARVFSTKDFFACFKNSIVLSLLRLAINTPIPILLALMVNEIGNMAYKRIAQTVMYLPHFISWVAIAGITITFLSETEGLVNLMIKRATGHTIPFLSSAGMFRSLIISTSIWKEAGWGTIIYLASITGIDQSLYEAATIDGANRFQRIWYITIPGIMNMIAIQFVLRVGAVMEGGFDQIFNLYTAPVYDTGDIIDTYIYRLSFVKSSGVNLGFPTAVGLFKNVINFILLMLANGVTRALGQETVL